MTNIHGIYNTSLSLLTDLYQLTMAYGYFKNGIHEQTGVFNLFFRKNPFKGGYAISAGLDYVIEFLKNYKFDDSDIDYLKTLTGNDGKLLFSDEFLEYLRNLKFTCTIDAVEEGNLIFPHEPIIRVKGPLIQAQLLETTLLNIINFQTLIATKASRIVSAAKNESVLEFGLRRAQGVDGGLSASRAAFIGGCSATSNVLAGKIFGIPVKGTHAHSWIMSFETEIEAFKKYAEAMPNNSLFLVDTYDTLEGVKKAVEIGKWLRETGHEMLGIRLDSGDLAYLSIESRKILDDGGFKDAVIVASNDLDEYLITSLKQQGAKITVWGVGTKLVTAYDQPALGGVYKLSAIKSLEGFWEYKIKLSEQLIKVSNPGLQKVKRYMDKDGNFIGDMIYDEILDISDNLIIDPKDSTRRKKFPTDSTSMDLLTPIFKDGELIYTSPSITEIQNKVKEQLNKLHSGIKRFHNPHEYPIGLEERLFNAKIELIMQARGEE
jgi:nicotinate phosphoribosyltransferase